MFRSVSRSPLARAGAPARRVEARARRFLGCLRPGGTGATVIALLAAAAPPAASQGASLAARAMGRPDAPLTIYEASDFQCPYCRNFAIETLPALEREYVKTGKVRFVFLNYPVPALHRYALLAAEVAMCAAAQGKFWRLHDLLFQRQPRWATLPDPGPYLRALADSAGAAPAPLARCVANQASEPAVAADVALASRFGARTTPTFIIEGGLVEGAAPIDVFREVLDSIYRAKVGPPH